MVLLLLLGVVGCSADHGRVVHAVVVVVVDGGIQVRRRRKIVVGRSVMASATAEARIGR